MRILLAIGPRGGIRAGAVVSVSNGSRFVNRFGVNSITAAFSYGTGYAAPRTVKKPLKNAFLCKPKIKKPDFGCLFAGYAVWLEYYDREV